MEQHVGNWTTATGLVNFIWDELTAAFFTATAGTVTVGETVDVKEMNFETDGYVLTGPGEIAISGPELTVNTATNVTAEIGAVISGAGGLVKSGDEGTLVLTADNTYTGNTLIAGGTLQVGNGGTTGSILGNVTNNGTLDFNRADGLTFGGVISGSGDLKLTGTGTVTLTGSNTYTGGTAISAGTLQIGNGGGTGSITGSVTNDAALVFNRSNNLSFGGEISGTGTVTKLGAATLTLTGNNTYTGGTTISAGTLRIGNGGATGSIAGDVVNNAALVVNRSGGLTLGGQISGTGTLTKLGTGTLTLTGSNSYAGGTFVRNGVLAVNGTGAISHASAQMVVGQNFGDSATLDVSGGGFVENANGLLGAASPRPAGRPSAAAFGRMPAPSRSAARSAVAASWTSAARGRCSAPRPPSEMHSFRPAGRMSAAARGAMRVPTRSVGSSAAREPWRSAMQGP